jgi:hypothetical protein
MKKQNCSRTDQIKGSNRGILEGEKSAKSIRYLEQSDFHGVKRKFGASDIQPPKQVQQQFFFFM